MFQKLLSTKYQIPNTEYQILNKTFKGNKYEKTIIVFLISFFISNNSDLYSQSGWFSQQSNTGVSLNSIYFVNSNTGWICGDSGKVLKTSDGGSNWIIQSTPTNYPLMSVFFLNENTGWCSGGVADFSVFPNRMLVLKTVNGGITWTQAYFSNSSYSRFGSIYFTDALHGTVVEQGGTGSGIVTGLWKSSDGGYSWLPIQSSAHAHSDLQFTDENNGWVLGRYLDDTGGDTAYISKSVNGGTVWNKLYQKPKTNLLSMYFINNNYGWVSGIDNESSPSFNFILKTSDGGNVWAKYIPAENTQLNHIFFIDNNIGWGCSGRIFKTTDGGMNWQLLLDYSGSIYNSIFFVDSLTGWVISGNGKIRKTITGGLTKINYINGNIPDNFSLSQNYPNPFNPSTVIQYSIPSNVKGQTSHVKLVIYNSIGKEISTLVNVAQTPGSYSVEWNAANSPSGIYFYKLTMGDFSEVRKMTLLK